MDAVEVTGVVLIAQPIGEYDKRLVILTRERGKITAFARGVRRQTSPLLAASNPFVFGRFSVYEGRNAYTLRSVEVVNYFTDLASCQPGVYYGFYFLELAGYYGHEGLPATEMVNLIYVALRAILKGNVPLSLMRRIYECRMMAENGEFAPPDTSSGLDPDARYALSYVASCKVTELFSFSLSPDAEKDFVRHVKKCMAQCVDRKFHTLMMIE